MALIEKNYAGSKIRIAGASAAIVAAAWLAGLLLEGIDRRILPLAAAVACGSALLGWWRWRLAVDLALLNLPLWIIVPMRLGVPNFSLVEIALLGVLIGGAARVAQTGRFRWYWTPLTPYLGLMSLLVVLSAALYFAKWFMVFDTVFLRVLIREICSVAHVEEASKYHALRGALTVLEGFVFFHVIVARARDPRGARRLVRISIFSAVLVSLFGICQYFTSWNRVDFEPWGHRINSTFPDVNSLASFLVANVFLLFPFLAVRRKARGKILAWAALVLLAVSLWMAHSRAAFGALLVTAPFYFFFRREKLGLEKAVVELHKRRRFLALVYVLLLLILGFVFLDFDWVYHTDLDWTRTTGFAARALKGRLNIWRSAFYNLAESPWFGRGIGTFYGFLCWHWENVVTPADWNWNPLYENAHNYFIQIFTETGIVGGGLFLLIVGLVIYQGLRALVVHRQGDRRIALGVLCAVVAFLLTCLTGHPLLLVEMNLWFWSVAALLFVPSERESVEFVRQQAGRRGLRRFVLAAILVAAAGRAIEAHQPRPTTFYGYGIHGVEFMDPARRRYPFFWVRKRAVCRVYQMYPDFVFCLRNPLGASRPITVTVRLDGRTVDRVRLDDAHWRVCRYRSPETIHTAVKVELLSDHEYKAPGDNRPISVQVQSLMENAWWGG